MPWHKPFLAIEPRRNIGLTKIFTTRTQTRWNIQHKTNINRYVDRINEGWLVSVIFTNLTLTNFLKDDDEPEEATT